MQDESRQAGAIIAEIEFEIGIWDQARHISRRELAERIYTEFAGCAIPMMRAKKGEISVPNS